jgi:hypothetical protein
MDNALTLAARHTFECDGYRFEKTPEAPVLALTPEHLFAALADAGLCERVQQQIFLAASREAVQLPGVRVAPIVPHHRCSTVDLPECDLIIKCWPGVLRLTMAVMTLCLCYSGRTLLSSGVNPLRDFIATSRPLSDHIQAGFSF